jgi:hypothetical protein
VDNPLCTKGGDQNSADYVTPELGGDAGEGYEIPDNSTTVTNAHYAAPSGTGGSTNMYNHLSRAANTSPLYSMPQPEYDRLIPAGQRIENTENYVVGVAQVRRFRVRPLAFACSQERMPCEFLPLGTAFVQSTPTQCYAVCTIVRLGHCHTYSHYHMYRKMQDI